MMQGPMNPLYNLVDRDYHETLDAYQPRNADFRDLVSARLPSDWTLSRKDIWFYCSSTNNCLPQQGWKIHISATPASAHEVLSRVTSVLFEQGDSNFKFALDLSTLSLLNSKNWSRGSSGKFITIYPPDNHRFLDLLARLHRATESLSGPYILSDHRYPGSRVLFYRYGGMRAHDVLDITGERVPMLVGPDGSEIPDRRLPFPVTPTWAPSLLAHDEAYDLGCDDRTLKGGRYYVESVLSFSNGGGVYRGVDRQTGERIVIKEARPGVSATADGRDAIDLLRKEYRLLRLVEETGIAPRPIDLFQEWEHWFLVEEYLEGSSLASFSAQHNILLRTRSAPADRQKWCETFRALSAGLAQAIKTLHDKNIVFADLSPANMLVTGEATVRLVDFEGAFELHVDRPSALYTPGFASPERLAGSDPKFEDDCYSMGAVLMSCLFPRNGLFHLRPEAKLEMMKAITEDAILPSGVAEILLALMDTDGRRRPNVVQVSNLFGATPTTEEAARPSKPVDNDYQFVVDGVACHLEAVATYCRRDRLFPSDPILFSTNPLSLAYGAAGAAYALNRITGRRPEAALDWLLGHAISAETYAPGLYVGLSGIAWTLLEMGMLKEAGRVFQDTENHSLLYQSSDLFYGASGWGLACLRFFLESEDQLYLDLAKRAGRRLLEEKRDSSTGCYWGNHRDVRVGLAHGASGTALFLLYLYLATGESRFLETGLQGLEFDLSLAAVTPDGGKSWPQSLGENNTLYPFWRYGSAGIGTVLLRYWRFTGSARYRSILEEISVDAARKYAVFPGRFLGLAGLGDFLLDMYEFTGESQHLESARRVAQGLMLFRVERATGIAFPGDSLSRLCCDYGTGSAGIALFLNRLLGRQGNDFMLDSLFDFYFSKKCPAPDAIARNWTELEYSAPKSQALRDSGLATTLL